MSNEKTAVGAIVALVVGYPLSKVLAENEHGSEAVITTVLTMVVVFSAYVFLHDVFKGK